MKNTGKQNKGLESLKVHDMDDYESLYSVATKALDCQIVINAKLRDKNKALKKRAESAEEDWQLVEERNKEFETLLRWCLDDLEHPGVLYGYRERIEKALKD